MVKRKPIIEVYRGQGRSTAWYWRCRAANGKIIADGSEWYWSKSNALRATKRFRELFGNPRIEIRDAS